MTDLRRELPQFAVFVHLLLHVVDDLSDLLGDLLDILASVHLVKVLILRGEGLELPVVLPLLCLLFFRHVLVIDVGATASEGTSTSSTSGLFFESLDPHLVDDSLPVLAEDALDPGYAAGHLYDVSHKVGDLLLKHCVARVVQCLPLDVLSVQDCENLEDRNDLLLVALDVVLEV